ncbi:MAG TPA: hypothetical protein VH280_15840 [Verrucomicrobiae bacterium]|jgi:hypothetical protein|nr:hypothetical protein [Verrucomicrobiae bacterium]
MKNAVFKFLLMAVASLFLSGCGKSSNKYTKELEEFKKINESPDMDVTTSPNYNFSSFSRTLCKTKVKVAITEVTRYNGEHAITLFPPDSFDPADPNYRPVRNMQVITVLPVGTLLRIDRLMKDTGEWGGVRVTATLESGENAKKNVYVDRELLAKNLFIWNGWSDSRNWDIDPDFLEVVTDAPIKGVNP